MVHWLNGHNTTLSRCVVPVRIRYGPQKLREVDQLVDRVLWEHEAAGSSPVFSTMKKILINRNYENNNTIPATKN